MDSKIIFVRTDKGEEEIRGRSQSLSGDIRRALLMVDGSSSFGEIGKRAAPSLRAILDDAFKDLLRLGFIQDKARAAHAGNVPKMVVPVKKPPTAASGVSPAMKQPSVANLDELDFTAAFRAPTREALAAEGAKVSVCGLDAGRIQQAQDLLGPPHRAFRCDVASRDDIAAWFAARLTRPITGLVAGAEYAKGAARLAGLTIVEAPGATGNLETNYEKKRQSSPRGAGGEGFCLRPRAGAGGGEPAREFEGQDIGPRSDRRPHPLEGEGIL